MSDKGKRWSVGIFILYAIFMILLVGAVIFSTRNNVELVTNNYYEKTLTYEKQIQAITNTRLLTQKPVVTVNKVKQQIILLMPKVFLANSIQGKVHFYRPSATHLDFSVVLNCDHQNQQTFPLQKVVSGKWKVQINWTAGSKDYYFEQVIFI